MSVGSHINPEQVKNLCERLGLRYDFRAEDRELRDLVLFHLGRDIEKLIALASESSISVHGLQVSGLLPKTFALRIYEHSPATKEAVNERNAYFHKSLDKVTDVDLEDFSNLPLVGNRIIAIFRILINLHVETSGFTTLLETQNVMMTDSEKKALLGRIRQAVDTNPKMRSKVLSMFPAPRL